MMNYEEKMERAIELSRKKDKSLVEEVFIRSIVDEALEHSASYSQFKDTYFKFAPIIISFRKKYPNYYDFIIDSNIIPLFAYKEDGIKTISVGTMCFLKHMDKIFGVTAAHVIDRYNVKLLIKGFEYISSDSFKRSNDGLDFAILAMNDIKFGFETCIKKQTVIEATACGFLSKDYKTPEVGKRKIRLSCLSTTIRNSTESQIFLRYNRSNVYLGNDYHQTGAIISGMSGGACITTSDQGNFFERKFSGIITDYIEKDAVVIATRVEKIVEFIERELH